MPLLVIDTALEACTAAIGGVPGSADIVCSEVIGRGHAERLFGLIEAALGEAGITIRDIDRFAVTVGPGSFTGVRVGVAAARGFMLVTGRPGIALSTLSAHADAASQVPEGAGRPVLATLDARAGQVYGQLFSPAGEAVTRPEIAEPGHFAKIAAEAGAALAGSGAGAVAAAAPQTLDILHTRSAPDPAALLPLAVRAEPGTAPPRPLYLRPPDAKPAANAAVARR